MSIHNLALLFKDCTVRSSTLRCFWLAIQVQRQPYLYGDWTRANVLEMFQPAPIILLAVYFFGERGLRVTVNVFDATDNKTHMDEVFKPLWPDNALCLLYR